MSIERPRRFPRASREPKNVDDDDTQPISVPRTGTDENLVYQVLLDGRWHQRMPGLDQSACGIDYHSEFAPLRRDETSGELCDACFNKRGS